MSEAQPTNQPQPEDDDPADDAPAIEVAAYHYNPGDPDRLAELLELTASAISRLLDGWSAVKRTAVEAGHDPDSPLVNEAALIMSYRLRMAQPQDEPGCELVPATAAGVVSWPPHVSDLNADVIQLWREAAPQVTAPGIVARLEDLLLERRDGHVWAHAQTAVAAYIEWAFETDHPLDMTAALLRAWELCRRFKSADMESRARQKMFDRARTMIDNGSHAPGTLLPLLGALARGPQRSKGSAGDSDPLGIDPLLREALGLYPDSYLVSRVAQMIRLRRPDEETLAAINNQEVDAYLAQAEGGVPAVAQSFLAQAIEVANRRGLHERADDATARLQRIDPSTLGLKRFESSIEIPRGPIEAWLEGFVDAADWREAIWYFLSTDPPTGQVEMLRDTERKLREASVLRRLFPIQLLSRDGLPSFTPSTEEERTAYEVSSVAQMHAENQGRWLAEGLRRLADRYGIPDEEALTESLSVNGTADFELAASLARAFRHWWHGDWEASAAVAFPLVEASVRSLLRELDEGIYRLQKAKEPGGYPGLWPMLDALEKNAFDESWAYFLRWLLLGPPSGINLRNDMAHGFVHNPGPVLSALLLRAAGLVVPLTRPDQNDASPNDPDGRRRLSTQPQNARARRARAVIEEAIKGPVAVPIPWPTPPPSLWAKAGSLLADSLRKMADRMDDQIGRSNSR